MSQLKLALVLNLIDKVSNPAKSAQGALGRLNQQTKKLDGLKKLNDKLGVSGQQLDASKQKIAQLGREMAATANPTATLTRQFEAAQRQTQRLQQSHRELRDRARETRTALRAEGVDTRNLAQAQERLQTQIAQTTAQMQRQQRVMQNANAARANASQGAQQIGMGAAGVVGATFAVKSLMEPINEMQGALGQVASLDVDPKVLKGLQETALQFSTEYGASAADFVASSYDIQSAISGLEGNDLANFTKASGVLAMGTKSDAATITNYMGTMYGIFEKNAKKIGKSEWVESLAGKTASAVKMFKTTGSEMSAAFTTIGAEGQAAGISMSEQLAILGKLQSTMSGSEAGTKYRAFLGGVGKAQEKLGLKFTDSQGKMLPMVDILGRIKGKFGDIDTVAKSDLLQKAFGRKEAVSLIKLLGNDVAGLSDNINAIGDTKGMGKAVKMAKDISSAWDRADSGFKALQITLGDILLPTILEGLDAFNNLTSNIRTMTNEFPNVAKYIGLGVLAVIALGASLSALSIIMGAGKIILAGWHVIMVGLTAAQWLWNAALNANPIGLVIAAVAALAASAVYLYNNWDSVMAWFNDKLKWLTDKFSFLGDMWNGLFGDKKADITQTIKQVSDKVPSLPSLKSNINNSDITAPKIRSTAPLGGNANSQIAASAPVSITVNPSPGMDEKQLAQLVQKELQNAQRQQQSSARSNLYDTP